MNPNDKIEITDTAYYAAYQKLKHTVVAPTQNAITFEIGFLGKTIIKRVIKGVDGNITLLLSDIIDGIKKNEYEFLPFSIFGLGVYKELTIDYTVDAVPVSLSVNIINAIDSPDSFNNDAEFLTRQRCIIHSNQFEQGLYFAGEITLESTAADGMTYTEIVGVDEDLSYLSLRDLSVSIGGAATKKAAKSATFNSDTQFTGFTAAEMLLPFDIRGSNTGSFILEDRQITTTGDGEITTTFVNFGQLQIDWGTGLDFGVCAVTGRIFPIYQGIGVGTDDDAHYLKHRYGAVGNVNNEFIVNRSSKAAQVEV